MSKNIRRIIAAIFVIGAFSIIEPNNLNFINTKVYAVEKPKLKSLYVNDEGGIEFSADVTSYVADVDKDTDEILVRAKPEDPLDTVKINGKVVTKDNYYRQMISLETGKNKIKIEINDDKTEEKSVYYVYVYRGGKDTVYLDDISINGSTIGFDKSTNFYNIELDEGKGLVVLDTIPGEGNYSIYANGTEINEMNSIKLKFKGIGKYIINISVKDEDTQRVGKYTLNIYLGIPVSPNVSESIKNALKPNQWVIVNGRWRYNDTLGENLKNTWFYDNKYKSYFHFSGGGNMQTGWIEDQGNYYFANNYGQMETGWVLDGKQWYFFGLDGAMKTGWINDNGKWYYLGENGTMATSWIVIDDKWYFFNSSGVMRTGWVYYGKQWYYLNTDGTMQTGWVRYENEWYYLNLDGTMKSGGWIYYNKNWYYLNCYGNMITGWFQDKNDKIYYFNEDGSMSTSPVTIEGYTYEFNKDGSVANF